MATVQLWVLPLDVRPPAPPSLTSAERRRAERYRRPDDARRFMVGRTWLRHVLGQELGIPAADVELVDGPGKPRLAAGRGPCFNLSRSGELAVVAVSPCEVGVDVEAVDGARGLEAALVACTPIELAALHLLPPPERAEAFLGMWTAKEAYLKGRGLGLAVAPDRVDLGPESEDGALPVRTTGERGLSRWWARRIRPRAGYVAAVAAEGRAWDIALREGVVPPEPARG